MCNSIQEARAFYNQFLQEEDTRFGYISNIAMLIYDELHTRKYRPKLKLEDRNQITDRILDLLFKDKS